MIDRIEGIQRISYNTTKILPIRPYSKEEQKQIISEINRVAEEYANSWVKVDNLSKSSDFVSLLRNAIDIIQKADKNLDVSSFVDNQDLVDFSEKKILPVKDILESWMPSSVVEI
jgi:predicted RNA-binding protein with EMAP domain